MQVGGGQFPPGGPDSDQDRHQRVPQLVHRGGDNGRGGAGIGDALDHGVDDLRDMVPRLVQCHGRAGDGDHPARLDRVHEGGIVGTVQKGQDAPGAVLQIDVLPAAIGDHAGEAALRRRKTKGSHHQQQRRQQDPDPLHMLFLICTCFRSLQTVYLMSSPISTPTLAYGAIA